MRPKRKQQPGKPPFEIIEEAFHLLRGAPVRLLAGHFIGTLPFVLALLYFWADMSKSAFAAARLPGGALALTLLFVWMKTWHVVYARALWSEVSGDPPRSWTRRRLIRVVVRQTIIQPSGLVVLPLAMVLLLPFGWVYALYQNLTVFDDGDTGDLRDLMRKAAESARLWPKQNLLLIWALSPYLLVTTVAVYLAVLPTVAALTPDWTGVYLAFYAVMYLVLLAPLSPFGMVIAVNIGMAILIVPGLINSLLGVQTIFVQSRQSMLNSTFFAIVCGLTYCCMDPLMKAAYVLRCFYGESIRTGRDLRVDLERGAGKILGGAALALLGSAVLLSGRAHGQQDGQDAAPAALAQPAPDSSGGISEEGRGPQPAFVPISTSVSPQDLDKALDQELHTPRYAWRLPRTPLPQDQEGFLMSVVRRTAETLRHWLQTVFRLVFKAVEWLMDHMPSMGGAVRRLSEVGVAVRVLLILLLVVLAALMAALVWRMRGQQLQATEVTATPVLAQPHLEEETTTADQFPEEGWLTLARDLLDRGELRLALRAVFLATLARLAQGELVRIARFKSNRDYQEELRRRAHARPEVLDLFSDSVGIYERVWYGAHETTRDLVNRVLANQEQLRTRGQEQ
jgi:hypothetical protein